MPANTVKVDRTTKWGNPFKAGQPFPYPHSDVIKDAAEAVDIFQSYLCAGLLDIRPEDARRELRGRNLACWCRLGEPCHADVLLALANRPAGKLRSGHA